MILGIAPPLQERLACMDGLHLLRGCDEVLSSRLHKCACGPCLARAYVGDTPASVRSRAPHAVPEADVGRGHRAGMLWSELCAWAGCGKGSTGDGSGKGSGILFSRGILRAFFLIMVSRDVGMFAGSGITESGIVGTGGEMGSHRRADGMGKSGTIIALVTQGRVPESASFFARVANRLETSWRAPTAVR